MPFGFAAGAAVIGAGLQADASRDAARTQQRGAERASQVSQAQFDRLRQDQLPFIDSGYGANQLLSRLLGINTERGFGPGKTGVEINREFTSANGRLVGDKYLPRDVSVIPTKKKGVFQVEYNGKYLGYLKPGGPNGKFVQEADLPEQAYEKINPGYRADGSGPVAVDGPGEIPLGAEGGTGVAGSSGQGLPTGFLTQLFGPQQFLQNLDPGYKFRLQQGSQSVLNNAAARTGAMSGPALKALIDYNQGAASQEYGSAFDRFQTQQGNIFQRLLALSSQGQSAAAGVGQQGVTTGGIIGGNITGAANAAAAGQIGAANAIAGGLGNAAGFALLPSILAGGGK